MKTIKEKVLHQPLSLEAYCSLIIAKHISLPGIEDNYNALIKKYPDIVARMMLQRVTMTTFETLVYDKTMVPYGLDYLGDKWFAMFDHYGGKKSTMDILTEVHPKTHVSPELKNIINSYHQHNRWMIESRMYHYNRTELRAYYQSICSRAIRLEPLFPILPPPVQTKTKNVYPQKVKRAPTKHLPPPPYYYVRRRFSNSYR
jgi:hypothetical protein